jgi:hypothetical protein
MIAKYKYIFLVFFILLFIPLVCASDFDSDGMIDSWERRNGLKIYMDDADHDNDGDGLTNLEEYNHGTNPLAMDTDADGILDKKEIEEGSDPNVPDSHNIFSNTNLVNILIIIVAVFIIVFLFIFLFKSFSGMKVKKKIKMKATPEPKIISKPNFTLRRTMPIRRNTNKVYPNQKTKVRQSLFTRFDSKDTESTSKNKNQDEGPKRLSPVKSDKDAIKELSEIVEKKESPLDKLKDVIKEDKGK